jgi:hypothetical protein
MSLLFSLALAAQNPVAGPAPLTDRQQLELRCVAALAIIASEQERGAISADEYPRVVERGRTWMGLVGEAIVKDTGRSQEQVRDLIIAEVARHQASVREVAEPAEVVDSEMLRCMPLLDAAVPPTPKPDLVQCAAMLQLAYNEVYGREGLSPTAKDLKTLAFVLDSRAREALMADGRSGAESDIILETTREKMLADASSEQQENSDLDYDHCFTLAAPESKTKEH